MWSRVHLFLVFLRHFWQTACLVGEVLVCLLVLIAGGGLLIAMIEEIRVADALYFAFVTALTIGYGDIVPQTAAGRFLAIALAMVGMVFIGLVVGIASHSLTRTHESRFEEMRELLRSKSQGEDEPTEK